MGLWAKHFLICFFWPKKNSSTSSWSWIGHEGFPTQKTNDWNLESTPWQREKTLTNHPFLGFQLRFFGWVWSRWIQISYFWDFFDKIPVPFGWEWVPIFVFSQIFSHTDVPPRKIPAFPPPRQLAAMRVFWESGAPGDVCFCWIFFLSVVVSTNGLGCWWFGFLGFPYERDWNS